MVRGGFPEPFLAATDQDADRWRMQYVDGLIRSDILDFERIHDLRAMQLTLELLRRRVGSPIAITSLAQDVACSPNTIKKYLDILEALFIVFRVTPFHHNIARSLLKEPKLYFYDTGMIKGDDGLPQKYLSIRFDTTQRKLDEAERRVRQLEIELAAEPGCLTVLADGRLALIEHKTTASDLAPDSDYWMRLRCNDQVYQYVLGARALLRGRVRVGRDV